MTGIILLSKNITTSFQECFNFVSIPLCFVQLLLSELTRIADADGKDLD